VTLLAEVARSYLQLRADQAARRLRAATCAERLTWKIAADKFKAGLGDELPVDQEAAQYRLTEATLAPLQRPNGRDSMPLPFSWAKCPRTRLRTVTAPGPARAAAGLPIAYPRSSSAGGRMSGKRSATWPRRRPKSASRPPSCSRSSASPVRWA